MNKKAKVKKWIKPRHKIITRLAHYVVAPFLYLKYGVRVKKFNGDRKRQYFIMMNHQTALDQFFVEMAFKKAVYYVASEDLFSNGFISKLLNYAVAPIPIKKQATDVGAVKTCLKVAKEGGSIAIAPEGNRTFSGKTEYIKPAIVGLVKVLKLPIAFMKIEGGYGVQPRWTDKPRKGKIYAYVDKIIEPKDYLSLTDDELYALIKKSLYVNEANSEFSYPSKKNAEYLERVVYVCPHCGLSAFKSNKKLITCSKCGFSLTYTDDKRFVGRDFDTPFTYVNDWYEYQENFINSLDITEYVNEPAYEEKADFSKVILYKKKDLIFKNAVLSLYSDKITVKDGERVEFFPFSEVTAMSVLGRNKLNLYHNDKVYQFKSDKRFNAVKFVHFYFHYQNVIKGVKNEQFLGL